VVVVCWFNEVAAVDLLARRAVEIPNLETKAGRLDECFTKGGEADVVKLALRGLDVVAAVRLEVAHGNEVAVLVWMGLQPSTGKELHGLGDVARAKGEGVLL
jgi:hypothetical protein